ncbi:RICIN domain-containing protein [Actinokineospora bangkokensis]|uniref:Coagulation factor 5/8 type domain-containing protein n=1 Tax=Actinokineospora bangkokensis TaxID=1193682 RepID=A0A1Q9LNZ3_9PSEU|nr:RICIN domain-containing protein [Actinokineospora bangkokensis]OLR93719.1 coagulation factor 5/8 type domain-containing protein [Actinokineospora bangkokensis]
MPAPRRRPRRALLPVLAAAVLVPGLLGVAAATDAAAASTGALRGDGSGKCLDVKDGSSADGAAIQVWSCSPGPNQTWTIGDDGTLRAFGKCLDVRDGATGDGAAVHLWTCYAGLASQRWRVTGARDVVNEKADKCLDVRDGSTADGAGVQLWSCTGASNQKWSTSGGGTPPPSGEDPVLGPNVLVFDPSMSASGIQQKLNAVFAGQETNQFGPQRYALLFKPGQYAADVNVGFFTQVAGLGMSPDDVTISGAVHAEADWFGGNATQNFWRGAENLSVTPTGGADRWAVSQAAPYRRMHLRGNLRLDDGGWSSGGIIADSKVDGQVLSGSQQQFLTRNSGMGGWTGSNYNMVFVGDTGAPASTFPNPPHTNIAKTPVVREKPFLHVDPSGAYKVFVPDVRRDSTGPSWTGTPAGRDLPLSDFYVVRAGATAASINAALAQGKNLLVTPGVYHVNAPIQVTRANTVVLGLGLATFVPDGGVTAMTVADVDGVSIAGVMFDAGSTNSDVLLQVGPDGASADHAANPSWLSDVYFRVGGAGAARATVSLRVNSDDVIGDHTWIWRADHGSGVGWGTNPARNGLVVNGDDVTIYGLFVEHYQGTQTVWNGERGRTYFYQNEMPYDPPNQASWMDGGARGYAAYQVADGVTQHQAWGLGSYCYFNVNPATVADRAFQVPVRSGVRLTNMVTVSLGGTGTIAHVINGTGDAANSGRQVVRLVSGP